MVRLVSFLSLCWGRQLSVSKGHWTPRGSCLLPLPRAQHLIAGFTLMSFAKLLKHLKDKWAFRFCSLENFSPLGRPHQACLSTCCHNSLGALHCAVPVTARCWGLLAGLNKQVFILQPRHTDLGQHVALLAPGSLPAPQRKTRKCIIPNKNRSF